MAKGGPDSKEENDPQAALEGSTCFESVYQDTWQEPWWVVSGIWVIFLPDYLYELCFAVLKILCVIVYVEI